MPYDAKDPDTIKAVKAAVDAALAEQIEEHEADIAGLKSKNTELLGKIAKIRKEGSPDAAAELERVEGELASTKTALSKATRDLNKAVKERDDYKIESETSSKAASNLLIENGLTEALTTANVGKGFLPAVKALLIGKAVVEKDGDKSVVKVDGKPLGEFVKSWSLSDEGKSYVTAPANGGGNSLGGKANGGHGDKKIISMNDYNANPANYAKDLRDGNAVLEGAAPAA